MDQLSRKGFMDSRNYSKQLLKNKRRVLALKVLKPYPLDFNLNPRNTSIKYKAPLRRGGEDLTSVNYTKQPHLNSISKKFATLHVMTSRRNNSETLSIYACLHCIANTLIGFPSLLLSRQTKRKHKEGTLGHEDIIGS